MATTFAALSPAAQWYMTLALLSVALLIGVVLAHRVMRDLKGESEERSDDPDDLIAPLTQAFAAGQMSKEEYDRIRESIRRGDAPGPAPILPIRRGHGADIDPGRVPDPSPTATEPGPPEEVSPNLPG